MNAIIRPAKPDDSAFLAWAILTAGRGHVKRGIWEVVIDRPERECAQFFERLTLTGTPHLFHHSCHLVAEVSGHPVATLGGHDPKVQGYPVLRQVLPEVFQGLGWTEADSAMENRAERVLCCVPEIDEGAWVIESVATLPEFRRRGIVDKLLSAILQQGRQAGFARAQIGIYIGNIPAQKAYEKHGFRIADEKRHPHFEAEIGAPGMARLLRDL